MFLVLACTPKYTVYQVHKHADQGKREYFALRSRGMDSCFIQNGNYPWSYSAPTQSHCVIWCFSQSWRTAVFAPFPDVFRKLSTKGFEIVPSIMLGAQEVWTLPRYILNLTKPPNHAAMIPWIQCKDLTRSMIFKGQIHVPVWTYMNHCHYWLLVHVFGSMVWSISLLLVASMSAVI